MGRFLNSIIPYASYEETCTDDYFVDKSLLIDELIPALSKKNRFLCITRPRRFGKSVMANMIGAFFGNVKDSRNIFQNLAISKSPNFSKHLNRHKIIYIDFSRFPRNCTSYEQYINRIQDGINQDLSLAYPDLTIEIGDAVWDVLMDIFQATSDKFIFIMDEWDAVFHADFITEKAKREYLLFLKNLLKDQVYVELAYMTGVLPIAKYSSGSELNCFLEYDMATSIRFSTYFGFSDDEIDVLFEKYKKLTDTPYITREDLKQWYDGYYTAGGCQIYNPRSIICALTDNQLKNYWTSSGPYDEIFYYIQNNIEEVRDDLVLMISGEGVETEIQSFAAVSMELHTKAEIYSAMVIYGLLTYKDKKVYIPNKELMEQFQKLLLTKDSLGYVYRLAKESELMLKATLNGDTSTMVEILKYAHDTESPIFSYNSEIELSAVVNLVYLSARDKYRVEREDKAGEGYVDFIFYPEQKDLSGIILELKVDSSPENAIAQIEKKGYILRFKGKLGEKPKYIGKVLAVGISYNRKTKLHSCKVKILN